MPLDDRCSQTNFAQKKQKNSVDNDGVNENEVLESVRQWASASKTLPRLIGLITTVHKVVTALADRQRAQGLSHYSYGLYYWQRAQGLLAFPRRRAPRPRAFESRTVWFAALCVGGSANCFGPSMTAVWLRVIADDADDEMLKHDVLACSSELQ